ncbi:hypothetical protein Tco_0744537 [Tanacetum coccineum]
MTTLAKHIIVAGAENRPPMLEKSKKNFQTQDLDAYDSDCDDLSLAKAVLMANLSSCDSDVLSEVPYSDSYLNDMLNQDVQEMTYSEQTLTESSWIEAMQEELNEFEPLKVWELEEGIDFEESFALVAYRAISIFIALLLILNMVVLPMDKKDHPCNAYHAGLSKKPCKSTSERYATEWEKD